MRITSPFKAGHSILTVILLSGCTAWSPPVDPGEFSVSRPHASRMRITLRNGQEIVLWKAHAVGDSLVGFTSQAVEQVSPVSHVPPQIQRIALADAEFIQVRENAPVRTSWAVIGVMVPLLLYLYFTAAGAYVQ